MDKVSIRVDDDGAAIHGFMRQHSAQSLLVSSSVDCLYFSSPSLLDCYIFTFTVEEEDEREECKKDVRLLLKEGKKRAHEKEREIAVEYRR